MSKHLVTEDDIKAVAALRSVIADAANHPGRDAAIAALDRMTDAIEHPNPFTATWHDRWPVGVLRSGCGGGGAQ